jgi:DNA uptake protein ComE-like DNA-binding protein
MENLHYTTLPAQENTLKFEGNAAYRIEGSYVHIKIDEIHNTRSDNLSGTLSLELWALDAPYVDGDFTGQALAGTQIGQLLGQHFLQNCAYQLLFQAPTAGEWHLCLMLREWDNNGFTTRDFVNFTVPYVVEAPASKVTVKHTDNSNIIKVSFTDKEDTPEVKTIDLSSLDEIPSLVTSTVTSKAEKADSAPAKKKKSEKVELISVNQAELETLEHIKGLSKVSAKGIVEARPFKKLNDLLNVKGIGKKVLEKIRSQIKL